MFLLLKLVKKPCCIDRTFKVICNFVRSALAKKRLNANLNRAGVSDSKFSPLLSLPVATLQVKLRFLLNLCRRHDFGILIFYIEEVLVFDLKL